MVINPYSWNKNANIFFIEQPVGVGFSYAEYGEQVGTTEEAAKDIANFVAIFFEHFKQFRGRGFHLAGESYAGRYLPVYAAEIYDQNAHFVEAGLNPINLKSVVIGNGLTDPFAQFYSGYEFGCSAYPFLSVGECIKLKQLIPRCKNWLQHSCIDSFDRIDCGFRAGYCAQELWAFVSDRLGWNPYDVRHKCEGDIDETLCYPGMTQKIAGYLDQPSIRSKLGVDSHFTGRNYTTCATDMTIRFFENLDYIQPTYPYVAALLERGVRVLAYVGDYDWMCNWVGVNAWTLGLEWSGQGAFNKAELRNWEVDGDVAGVLRSFGGLTFATIHGAGHMAPYDQPKASQQLVQRWLVEDRI
ncbi:hypothetical protein NP233_g1633 [Leucocoprinus birnbaumii]|uniref:Carboxypeptidase n=1 Tax=Leucocoprinus birnbaumii TaxID=56174 RepID=A0AAD5VZL5_9AGAR|nr:hypothetical protein NP233_g1633 [Leucocoprinus birnbaumii]